MPTLSDGVPSNTVSTSTATRSMVAPAGSAMMVTGLAELYGISWSSAFRALAPVDTVMNFSLPVPSSAMAWLAAPRAAGISKVTSAAWPTEADFRVVLNEAPRRRFSLAAMATLAVSALSRAVMTPAALTNLLTPMRNPASRVPARSER